MDESSDAGDSADEALSELLGLTSLKDIDFSSEERPRRIPETIHELCHLRSSMESLRFLSLREAYSKKSVCIFPEELSVPAAIMRQLADQVVFWSAPNADKPLPRVQRTYESITRQDATGNVVTRRELTRLENLQAHEGWRMCDEYIGNCISSLLQTPMILYKTKLNLKPPGGAGFAPHVDAPSLRLPFPLLLAKESFVTVMIAIDDMTVQNGCLRVARRSLSDPPVPVVPPCQDGNPDGDGRAGALVNGEKYVYEDIECPGGTIVAFDGWVPHRSSANLSPLGRRAVFLTYHAASTGNLHDLYYERMQQLRNKFLEEQRLHRQQNQLVESEATDHHGLVELKDLASVPK